jgi:hypothetical protein
MKTRIIHTKVWQDDFVVDLSPIQKLIFFYYITNDNIGLTGIYEVTDRQVAFDTGVTKAQIQEVKALFQKKKKILFYKNWVYIVNATKLNGYIGEKLQKAIKKEKSFIPDTVLEMFNTLLEGVDMVSDTSDTSINHKSEIINQKEGIVKGKQILDDQTFQATLEEKFPEKDISLEIEKMKDWLASSGGVKKDYAAFARNWLRNSYEKKSLGVLEEIIIRPPTEVQT